MADQHFALPLTVERSSVTGNIMNVTDASGRTPAFVGLALAGANSRNRAGENTDFIVRACNAHYQMLEALKVAQSALAMLTDPEAIKTNRVQVAWATAVEAELAARNAIAAAEAEAR